jgi:hypothetical protein
MLSINTGAILFTIKVGVYSLFVEREDREVGVKTARLAGRNRPGNLIA